MKFNLMDYCNEKLWLTRSRDLPFYRRLPLTAARVVVLTIRRFLQNQCTIKASALTFYTVFSIVPVLALIFGISKGLGMEKLLDQKIREAAAENPMIAEKIIAFSDSMLQSAKGGVVAGIGVLLLLWSAIKLLSSIENNLNEIWGIPRGRSLVRKITDYVAILIICPVLLLAAGSGVVFAAAQADRLAGSFPGGEYFNFILQLGNGLFPLCVTWLVFTFIYIAIPNTKVKLKAGLIAGLFAAAAYTMLQSFYVFAQFTTSKFNAIYGSFAALPLFLTWLNLSWIVILAGAQLSFAIQNVCEYEMQPVDCHLSTLQKQVFCIQITALIIRRFEQCRGTMADDEISAELELPIRTVRSLLYELVQSGILMPVHQERQEIARFQLALPPEKISILTLIRRLKDHGGSKYMNKQSIRCLNVCRDALTMPDNAPANLPISQISPQFLKEEKAH